MKKTQAINLTQKVFRFKKDNFCEHDGFNVYRWKALELCMVFGVMEFVPGQPLVCVGLGDDLYDFEHIPLEEFENVVDISRDFSPELATANRPPEVVVKISEFLAGTNQAT